MAYPDWLALPLQLLAFRSLGCPACEVAALTTMLNTTDGPILREFSQCLFMLIKLSAFTMSCGNELHKLIAA